MRVPAKIDAIVIGASAGGVEALSTLLATLPAHFNPAVLVVLHLPPDRPSLLSDVLGHRCALPVRDAMDKEPIAAGTVYCAPADCHLLVEPDFSLSLSIDDPVNFSRPSIDVLFESAALAYRERVLAVVLTGANDDGARGLATVRAQGGVAWIQEPTQAQHEIMPAAALAHAGADAVMSLQAMATALERLSSGVLEHELQAHHE
jgi:two-component system, chemotaxis family, protein-glutamate methylesterase/glutaminase